MANLLSTIVSGSLSVNVDSSGSSISTVNNGNGSRWYGRITTFNSTSDKSVFLGTYASVAVVGAHNNALTAWANLYVNNVDGVNGGNVYLPTNSYVANNSIIHSGNIGSQSVNYASSAGNADTVDGFHVSVAGNANTIPTRNANGYLIPENWIQLNGIYGLYSPTNGAHLRPNNANYGSWLMTGSRNGWQGIEFDSGSAGNVTLMVATDSNTSGFHNNSYGWQVRWSNGILYVGKGAYGGGADATVWDSSNAPRANFGNLMYYQGFELDANTMATNSTGFTYANNAPFYGPIARFSTGGGYDLWIGGAYSGGGNAFYLRTRNGDAGTFNAWREIITSGNIGSQSVNYATSAGDSASLGGFSSGKFPKQDYYYSSSYNWDTIEAADTASAIVLRIESAVLNPPANDVYNWSLWQQGTRSRGSQIAVEAYGASRMFFRGSDFDSGSYGSWNEIVHSNNIGSYALTSLPSHNHDDRYLVKGGSWYGVGLPGSRWGGFSVSGGEIVFGDGLPNAGQMGILIDGAYLAGENNGFWSLASDNSWGSRRGMYWDGSYLNFTTNSPIALFSDVRATIFYDSQDTGYYLDPNGTSNLLQLNTATRARWNMPRTWYDRSSRTSDQNYWTGTNGWGLGDGNWDGAWRGGFAGWDIWGTDSGHPQGAGYVHAQGIVSGQHLATSDGSSGYGWMMVGAGDATPNRYWLRGKWGGTTSGWTEMMTSNNNPYAWNMNQYVRTTDAPTFAEVYNNGWFRTVGHQGLYNPTNGAHFYPNNASYGSWRIDGSRNGWHGLHFASGSTLMMNSAETGVHREGYGWQFRWYNGSMFVSRGTYGGGTEYTVIDSGTIGSQSVNYATSAGNSSTTSQIVFNDLKTNFPSGAGGGHSFAANHYSMGLDSGNGGWDGPHYRDVIIGYHTGVRIGAHYSGIRFYNNSPTTDANNDGNGDGGEALLMTIGGYVGTANHTDVVVNNNLFANVSMRAPIFYDSNDTNYYGNFAGFSRLSEAGITNTYTYNYFNVESSRAVAEFGHVGLFRSRQSATTDYIPFSFQSQYGNHSWGQVARFHIEGGGGGDRPSIQFSSAYNNTRWNIGYCTGSDDHFRITQNMGYRPDLSGNYDGWGTERFRINTDGTAYLPSTLYTNEISHANGRVSLTGNLHIDSYNGNDIYMNYYSARGTRIYVGSGTLALHVNTDGLVYMPTVVVNSHSDNTKGYRINNTSGTAVSAMFTNSANALVLAAGALDQVQMNKKVFISGAALGVNIAASATAGRIDASNDIVAYSTSDERFKENITPIANALDKVKTLTGVEFDWKMETKDYHGYVGHDVGVIAQQVKAVLPEAVRTNANGYLAVRYEKLIGLLIEANKELAARVEELEKKLN